MVDAKTQAPAYVPFKTFITVIDSLASFMPDRIDPTMWPSYSGGIKSQLMGALKFLRLVDDKQHPTEALKQLAHAPSQHRPAIFKDVMKVAYPVLMGLDLTKATPGSFDAEMRKFGLEGDTHRKAASFFLQAARWASVPLSPLLTKKGSLSSSRRRRVTNGSGVVRTPKGAVVPVKDLNPPPASGSIREILLSDGSKLFLRTEKDLFQMNTEDRNFTMKLLEQIETYEAEHPPEGEDEDAEEAED